MFNPPDYLDDLITLAKQAGDAIIPYWRVDTDVTYKADRSPVTQADQAAEDIIVEGLLQLTPNIPIIAEELAEAGHAPDVKTAEEYWLVDPLDGTKEFIKGTVDFTINIGLVRNGVPVFGLVYLPATKDLYYGGQNMGAFFNHDPIKIRSYNPSIGLTMIGSKSHPNPKKQELRKQFLKGNKVSSYVTRGSSVKFCMIADGTAHLYPRFVPTYEWDTCAAHAMLLECGGNIIDFKTGQRLVYGKTNFLNGPIVTGTNQVLNILKPSSSQIFITD